VPGPAVVGAKVERRAAAAATASDERRRRRRRHDCGAACALEGLSALQIDAWADAVEGWHRLAASFGVRSAAAATERRLDDDDVVVAAAEDDAESDERACIVVAFSLQ